MKKIVLLLAIFATAFYFIHEADQKFEKGISWQESKVEDSWTQDKIDRVQESLKKKVTPKAPVQSTQNQKLDEPVKLPNSRAQKTPKHSFYGEYELVYVAYQKKSKNKSVKNMSFIGLNKFAGDPVTGSITVGKDTDGAFIAFDNVEVEYEGRVLFTLNEKAPLAAKTSFNFPREVVKVKKVTNDFGQTEEVETIESQIVTGTVGRAGSGKIQITFRFSDLAGIRMKAMNSDIIDEERFAYINHHMKEKQKVYDRLPAHGEKIEVNSEQGFKIK